MESDIALDTVKRKVYLVALSFGALVAFGTLAVYVMGREATVLDYVSFSLLGASGFLLSLLLWKQWASTQRVEQAAFGILAFFLLVNLFIYSHSPLPDEGARILGFNYGLSLLFLLAYLVFGAAAGLRLSLALWITAFSLSASYFVRIYLEGGNTNNLYLLSSLYLVYLILIALLFFLGRMQEKYVEAHDVAQAMVRYAALDFLTGLPNRWSLQISLDQELETAERYDKALTMIMFDLDNFKQVNDRFGHDLGDYVLQEVTRLASTRLRKADWLGRWGGEEFLIIAPETGLEQGRELAERLRSSIEGHCFGQAGQVTASFGVSTLGRGDSTESLLKQADQALYRAKALGRNRVESGQPVTGDTTTIGT